MAAENEEFRDRMNQSVDRELREGTFDGVTRRFYGDHGSSVVGGHARSRVPDTTAQFKAIDTYLARVKDRMEAADAARARILGQMTRLEQSVADLRRKLRSMEKGMMNIPGESE